MRLKELKLKNKNLLFSIFIVLILLSSCNQEEGKFVTSQYNFSYTQNYEILKEKPIYESDKESIPFSDFNQSIFLSSSTSLSYGASFTKDSIGINQMVISNNQFNWTFSPVRFDADDMIYFGSKNLIIPNKKMLGENFNCDIFLEDGTIIRDKILNPSRSIQPLKESLLVLNDMLLIINPIKISKDFEHEKSDSMIHKKINLLKIMDLDISNTVEDANYIIKLYKENKLLLECELNLDLSSEYYLFKSSYLEKCDIIFLAKKVSNSALSCNLYTIK